MARILSAGLLTLVYSRLNPISQSLSLLLTIKVWGLGFGVWGLGFGVWGLGFGVWGLTILVKTLLDLVMMN